VLRLCDTRRQTCIMVDCCWASSPRADVAVKRWSNPQICRRSFLLTAYRSVTALVLCTTLCHWPTDSRPRLNSKPFNTAKMQSAAAAVQNFRLSVRSATRRWCFHRRLFVCLLAGLRKTTQPFFLEKSVKRRHTGQGRKREMLVVMRITLR